MNVGDTLRNGLADWRAESGRSNLSSAWAAIDRLQTMQVGSENFNWEIEANLWRLRAISRYTAANSPLARNWSEQRKLDVLGGRGLQLAVYPLINDSRPDLDAERKIMREWRKYERGGGGLHHDASDFALDACERDRLILSHRLIDGEFLCAFGAVVTVCRRRRKS